MAEFINPALVPKVTLPSGEEVPCVGMGTFGSDRVSAEDVSAAVAGAVRSGYRMFDCAACYGNEPQIGKVFKDAFDEGVVAEFGRGLDGRFVLEHLSDEGVAGVAVH